MELIYDYLRIFGCECKIKLARAMEFRFDFITGFFFGFIGSFVNILFQFFIYSKTKGFPGWSFDQVLLFQSVLLLVHGIRETVFGNVRPIFESFVQYGGVDRVLLYPFPSLGMVLVKGFQFNAIPSILAGLITLIYSIQKLNLVLRWWHVGLFLLFIFVGMILYIAFIIFHCSLAFSFVYVDKLRELFDQIIGFGCYPAEIFSGLVKVIYLSIIPIAVFVYFPSQALMGRLNIICAYGIAISLGLFFIAIHLWNVQLKKYTSAGG